MPVPTQYQTVIPYLLLNDVLGFLDFVHELFGADIVQRHMHNDTDVAHAEIKIGNATILCGSVNAEWPPLNSSLFIYVDDADIAYHKALTLGASVVMELSNQEYGRTCGVKDEYGNIWWMTSV